MPVIRPTCSCVSISRLNPKLQELTVHDWKRLCHELHLHVAGRKEELQRRALAYLTSEEGRKRVHASISTPLLRHVGQVLGLPVPGGGGRGGVSSLGKKLACVCAGARREGEVLRCGKCDQWQHKYCVGWAARHDSYQCPACELKAMEPLDAVVESVLESVAAIVPGQGSAREFPYMMSHREENLERLTQVRCVRIDQAGYVQRWPKDGAVVVNQKTVEEFTPSTIETRTRKDFPLEVTGLTAGVQNSIALVKRKDHNLYVFGLFRVEKTTLELLIARLSTREVLSEAEGKAFISARVRPSDDISTPNYTQVLRCPLTRLLPDLPARGVHCLHIQCFDLPSFVILQDAAQANRWRCPICRGSAYRVVVDKYVGKIVAEAKAMGRCYSAEFDGEGGYRLIRENRDVEVDCEEEGEGEPRKRAKWEKRLKWNDFVQGVDLLGVYSSSAYERATGGR